MARVKAGRIAWAVAAANAVLLIVAPFLHELGGLQPLALAMTLAFSGTGALVVSRHPRNPIGWLLLASGTGAMGAALAPAIADRAISQGNADALLTRIAADYASASWILMMLPSLTFVLLLFPDGRLLPGRRWRVIAWSAGVGIGVGFVTTMLKPGRLEDYPQLTNPLGVKGLEGADGPALMLVIFALLGSAASLVVRYRNAAYEQKEQIKWLAYAGAVAAVTFAAGLALFDLLPETVVYGAMMLSVLGIPIATAVAILRYRLYDIDVVIRRTLVYAVLTATLAATYLVTVLLLELVLPDRSDLAVAASTLAAAAVLGPARRRIQRGVDRRFYRRRYDVERTLAAFGVRLRDELDLDAVSAELQAIATETMQPAHVSLWLRAR
jgi:hypothetical protein